MTTLITLLLFIIGLFIGSFLGAYSYRLPKGISIAYGRSFCPKCKVQINWYDNIPLLSYLLLKGKCRNCNKKISKREPIIELITGIVFSALYLRTNLCLVDDVSQICSLNVNLKSITLPFFLFVFSVIILISVIDYENKVIPDALVFFLFGVSFFIILLFSVPDMYMRLFSGFAVSSFLLFLNLITNGKGMGFGDVKYVIPLGFLVSWPGTFIFLTSSFIVGGLVAFILLMLGKAHIGKTIPFGPFLSLGFLICILSPYAFIKVFFPFF